MAARRTRVDSDTKTAVVEALRSYRTSFGEVLPNYVVAHVAVQFNVGGSTIRKWLTEADRTAALSPGEMAAAVAAEQVRRAEMRRPGFEFTADHLVAMRSYLNIKEAHAALFPEEMRGSNGWVAYSTFARAFKNLPASIREGILDGWDAMAKHQTYLSMAAPHRNHTWHLDHTEADVWVSTERGQVFRPWITCVRDNATGMRLAAVAYQGKPNEDSICDTLATAAHSKTYDLNGRDVSVGGLPTQLVLDNAKEHFAEAVTKGAMLLGVLVAPTRAFYKHQNGPAESTFSGLNKQLLKGIPGYKKGGNGDNGQPLIAAKYADKVNPNEVLTFESFQKHLDQWVIDQNTKTRMHRLGKQTPLTAWADDPTPIRDVAAETVRMMMQRASKDRAINGEGIRFRGVNYLAPELSYYREKGLRVEVRYLKRETRFIEVFYQGDWVCRAVDRDLLTPAQKRQILANREKDLDLLNRVNHSAKQDRLHRHATTDADEYDDQDGDIDEAVVDEAVASVTDLTKARTRAPKKTPAGTPESASAEFKRVDPTTPTRSKRSPAPPKTVAEQRRRQDKKNDQARARISRRPGSNFGDTPTDQQ